MYTRKDCSEAASQMAIDYILNSSCIHVLQVPMSRLEPDEDLRKRYAAMEDRLSVST